jgi:DNA-binding transcriptional regulator YiaG
MTGPQAVETVHQLGLSQARFARLAGLHPNALTKWANGAQPHGPAITLLKLLVKRPELLRVIETEL